MENKLETISNLFEGKEIRSHWNIDEEEYYFSVVDVINALTDSKNPNDYWYRLKTRLSNTEKSEISTKCRQLKLKSKDGKYRETDVLDTKGILTPEFKIKEKLLKCKYPNINFKVLALVKNEWVDYYEHQKELRLKKRQAKKGGK